MTTKAGERLLDEAWDNFDTRPWGSIADHVGAIEAEARAEVVSEVRAALTSEDEIAHGEAWSLQRRGLGRCAYCGGEWPCRTQRGIDRLLAKIGQLGSEMGSTAADTGPETPE